MDVSASVDIGRNLTTLLEKLAAQIGTTADKIFPWYVQQQVIEGYLWMGLSLSAVIIGAITTAVSWRKADFDGPGNFYVLVVCFGVLLFVFGFLFSVFGAQTSVSQIMNPNYYALKSMTADMARLIGK